MVPTFRRRMPRLLPASAQNTPARSEIDNRAPWPRWPSRIRAARGLASLAGFVKILSLRPSGGLRTLDACGGSGSRCSATCKCSTSPVSIANRFGDAQTPGYGVSIVAAKPGPVTTSRELTLVAQRGLAGPTGGLDTLLVAGDRGTSAAMRDRRSRGPAGRGARWLLESTGRSVAEVADLRFCAWRRFTRPSAASCEFLPPSIAANFRAS
jgi:hypothetical protein